MRTEGSLANHDNNYHMNTFTTMSIMAQDSRVKLTREPVKHALVVSDLSLQGFLNWASAAYQLMLSEVLAVVNIRNHRCGLDAFVTKVAHTCGDKGQYRIREKDCNRPKCERCEVGTGGYYFQWISKRWTPYAALVNEAGVVVHPVLGRFLAYQLPPPWGLCIGKALEECKQPVEEAFKDWRSWAERNHINPETGQRLPQSKEQRKQARASRKKDAASNLAAWQIILGAAAWEASCSSSTSSSSGAAGGNPDAANQ